jgi:diguanylate cyclase (GGDEF)-like protein
MTWTDTLHARVSAAADERAALIAKLDLVVWLADADPRAAPGLAVEAMAAARALDDPVLLARAHRAQGHAKLFSTDPRTAHDELEEARRRYASLDRAVGVAWCDLLGGIALEYLGDPGGATVRVERALAAFRTAGDLAGEARALNTLGAGQAIMDQLETSIETFQRSSELAARVQDPVAMGLARLNAAEVRGRLGVRAAEDGHGEAAVADLTAALNELREVHEHVVRTGLVGMEAHALAYQVVPLVRLGRSAEAVEVSEQAIARAGALELDNAAAPALHFAGMARLASGDLELAATHLQGALALYEQWELTHDTVAVLALLAEVEERLGDIAAALEVHKRLLVATLRHRDGLTERENQVAAARYEAERELQAAERGRREVQQLTRANRRLADERRAMERLAQTDALTGLANRRHFDAQLTRLLVQAELTGDEASLVLIDIDHFKRVNDRHSHVVGDGVLRVLGREIARHSRVSDLAARIGGEEFAVLLPHTGYFEAFAVAERLRSSVAGLDLSQLAPRLRVTVSAGVASSTESTRAEGLLAAADGALYAAKRGGRNRVCGARGAAT